MAFFLCVMPTSFSLSFKAFLLFTNLVIRLGVAGIAGAMGGHWIVFNCKGGDTGTRIRVITPRSTLSATEVIHVSATVA